MANAYRAYRQTTAERKIMVGPVRLAVMPRSRSNNDNADHRCRRHAGADRGGRQRGSDIVRVSCPDEDSTRALREICRESPVPIVADIRPLPARHRGCRGRRRLLRINPGNIGKEERVRGDQGRTRWLFHADRGECRIA